MKRFFKTLKEKMTAYEIFLILISSIVGAVFSLIGELEIEISIYICVSIIAFFLIATVIVQWIADRFNVLRLMAKFNRQGQYNLTIALGTNLSVGLWHTYKLKLRLKVGKQIKKAAEESSKNAPPKKQYELKYILASTLIDDLGYTNYILDDAEEAYINIRKGIKIIDESIESLKGTSDEEKLEVKLKELKLKGLRHEMGMIDKIEHFLDGQNKVKNVRLEFNALLDLMKKSDSSCNSDAVLCAEYAVIKDEFLRSQTDDVSSGDIILSELANLMKRIELLHDTDRREEWRFKCLRLQWEIQLFFECSNIIENYEALYEEIIRPADKTINRFIDIYKRFLLYSQYLINNLAVSDKDAETHIKKYKANWKNAKKIASEFLLGCEAKKQVKEIDEINKEMKSLLKKKAKSIIAV